jgi:hypothetical protein
MKSRRNFIKVIGSTAASFAIGNEAFAEKKKIKNILSFQDLNFNFDVSLNYESQEFQKFLFDDSQTELFISPTLGLDFSNLISDRRNGFENAFPDETVFFVNEKWGVYDDSSLRGINNITVVYKAKFKIMLRYWISFNTLIDEADKEICRNLFFSFEPGTDVAEYINKNLPSSIDINNFSIDTEIQIEKEDKIEFDISQRTAFKDIYNGETPSTLHFIDGSLATWYKENKTEFVQLLPNELDIKSEPLIFREVVEIKKPQEAEDNIANVVKSLLDFIVPSSCGNMNEERIKIATIGVWPEFKLDWGSKIIKIGCTKITIKYPILRIRISKIVVYAYFSLPVSYGQTAFQIAYHCAVSSALGSAILGVILANPGVAIVSFQTLFQTCVKNEVISCLNGGLATIKEITEWS